MVPLSLDVFCEAIVDNTSGLYMLSVAWEMPDGVGGSSSMDLIEQVVINTTIVHNETGVEDFLYSKTFSPTVSEPWVECVSVLLYQAVIKYILFCDIICSPHLLH